MTTIRQPAVAGTFYPTQPGRLQSQVTRFLDNAVPDTLSHPPKAIIAPHAGYIYSGPIAGSAFKPLQSNMAGVTRIVIIGPAHTLPIQGLATVSVDAFATPLGSVPIDKASMEAIRPFSQLHINDAAHRQEHSLEVMLPFLQTIAGEFSIVPIVAGHTTAQEVAEILTALWNGPETLIVISSDLSHYNDYDTAQILDQQTAAAIQNLQPDKLKRNSACGLLPIQGLLLKAEEEGLTAKTVDLRNSGDTAGTKDRVVGYGAFHFY